MEMNGRILAEFFADLDPEKSSSFVDISENIRRGVEKVGVMIILYTGVFKSQSFLGTALHRASVCAFHPAALGGNLGVPIPRAIGST